MNHLRTFVKVIKAGQNNADIRDVTVLPTRGLEPSTAAKALVRSGSGTGGLRHAA